MLPHMQSHTFSQEGSRCRGGVINLASRSSWCSSRQQVHLSRGFLCITLIGSFWEILVVVFFLSASEKYFSERRTWATFPLDQTFDLSPLPHFPSSPRPLIAVLFKGLIHECCSCERYIRTSLYIINKISQIQLICFYFQETTNWLNHRK